MITVLHHYPTIGENYVTNPSCEPVPNLTYWSAYNGCPKAIDTTEKHTGGQSMKYTTNNATVSQGGIVWTNRVVDKGTWVIGAWIKCSLAGQPIRIEARWATANTATGLGQGGGYVDIPATGEWQYIESRPFVFVTSPAGRPGCVALSVRTYTPLPPVGTILWVDDAVVKQVA